jgi:hypothetical protein
MTIAATTRSLAEELFVGGAPNQVWVCDKTEPSAGRWVNVADLLSAAITNAGIVIAALPTADPHVAGEVWNDAGVLKASAG